MRPKSCSIDHKVFYGVGPKFSYTFVQSGADKFRLNNKINKYDQSNTSESFNIVWLLA